MFNCFFNINSLIFPSLDDIHCTLFSVSATKLAYFLIVDPGVVDECGNWVKSERVHGPDEAFHLVVSQLAVAKPRQNLLLGGQHRRLSMVQPLHSRTTGNLEVICGGVFEDNKNAQQIGRQIDKLMDRQTDRKI